MIISNRIYDILKWIAQILLPAIGTLYFAISGIWGLPYSEQVVGTITAIDTFLGILLGINSAYYYKQAVESLPESEEIVSEDESKEQNN